MDACLTLRHLDVPGLTADGTCPLEPVADLGVINDPARLDAVAELARRLRRERPDTAEASAE